MFWNDRLRDDYDTKISTLNLSTYEWSLIQTNTASPQFAYDAAFSFLEDIEMTIIFGGIHLE